MYQRTHLSDEERTVLARVKQRRDRERRAARTPEQIERARLSRHPTGTKRCNRCGRDLPFDRFNAFAREPDGLHPHCNECRAGLSTQQP
jgi:NAD-dependent SIR2 family protein deacetylase